MVQVKLNGSWIDWIRAGLIEQYLYKQGDLYSSFTGGWPSAYFTNAQTGSIAPTFGATCIKCSAAGTNQSSSVYSQNMIDITGYESLTINVTQVTAFGHLVIANAVPAALSNAAASIKITTAGQRILDISKFSGKYYISVGTSCSDTTATHSIEFDSLKLS